MHNSDSPPNEHLFTPFLEGEIDQLQPSKASFHVLPVPYEASVSYGGGTALGPAAILAASPQLELWDGFSRPADAGIYTCPAIDCNVAAASIIDSIATATANIINTNAIPVVLGGEHTASYGAVKGIQQATDDDFGVVQIDAHADLRHAYEGNSLSHASVMKRIVEMGIPLLQLGTRAYCEEEIQARQQYGVHYQDADELVPQNITKLNLPDNFPQKVYFTLDVDGMDPSVFPSTGTPVPGGLGWYQTLSLFESLCAQREVIGFDIMEFAPITGFHAYNFSAAMLTYKLMGILQRSRNLKAAE